MLEGVVSRKSMQILSVWKSLEICPLVKVSDHTISKAILFSILVENLLRSILGSMMGQPQQQQQQTQQTQQQPTNQQ